MKKTLSLLLFFILLSSVAGAQILVSVDEQTTCGDGIREGHEMCEPETDQDLCAEAGKILGIVMVCDERDCTCLPKRMDCGNEIREGVEYCDPGEKEDKESNDFCDELGQLFNETFTCDPDSCLCSPENVFGAPKPSVCGDGNVTGIEECETDTDCRADQKCENCTCILKERITAEDVLKEIEQNATKETEDIKESEKTVQEKEKKEFDPQDLVGTVLPGFLQEEFEAERVNVYVASNDGSTKVFGVVTQHSVIQDIKEEALERATFDAYVDESKANQIIASGNQADALQKAMEENEVTYKPRGLFARVWYWFAGLFK